ncbi:MAG: glycosyltransferase [Actinomycetota bacterium]|nr:glycosyltransferase [Actinomycetota bacterium]
MFVNPIRYTSLGLAVREAMALGLPIVGLATTEMATVVQNGVNGYVETDVDRVVDAHRTALSVSRPRHQVYTTSRHPHCSPEARFYSRRCVAGRLAFRQVVNVLLALMAGQ